MTRRDGSESASARPEIDAATLPALVRQLAEAVSDAGGRILVVGGWVRDALRGVASRDLDLEVYGLAAAQVDALLTSRGFTPPVGRQFRVWRHTRHGIDVALPRGTSGPDAASSETPERSLTGDALLEHFERSARERDLRLNAIAFDPLARSLLDPLGGCADLAAGRLRAAADDSFGQDPLRVLRVARLAAALDAQPDEELIRLCRGLDLGAVPKERLAQELERILLELPQPWRAIEWLEELGQLEVFPPLAALIDVPQDPIWHPEGDVFVHTGRVVDGAAAIAREERLDREPAAILLFAALCHDLGKPATTERGEDGRIRSRGHDALGAEITRDWLASLRFGARRIEAVATLVHHHLAPAIFVEQGAKGRGYRRLARKLEAGGVTPIDLERIARADHLGRTTPDALAGRFDAGPRFLAAARDAFVERGPADDVVRAATLMSRGIAAGPELGRLLARAREIQDDTGLRDEAAIVARVFAERSPSADVD